MKVFICKILFYLFSILLHQLAGLMLSLLGILILLIIKRLYKEIFVKYSRAFYTLLYINFVLIIISVARVIAKVNQFIKVVEIVSKDHRVQTAFLVVVEEIVDACEKNHFLTPQLLLNILLSKNIKKD